MYPLVHKAHSCTGVARRLRLPVLTRIHSISQVGQDRARSLTQGAAPSTAARRVAAAVLGLCFPRAHYRPVERCICVTWEAQGRRRGVLATTTKTTANETTQDFAVSPMGHSKTLQGSEQTPIGNGLARTTTWATPRGSHQSKYRTVVLTLRRRGWLELKEFSWRA